MLQTVTFTLYAEKPIDNDRHVCLKFTTFNQAAVLHGFAGYFYAVLYRDITLSEQNINAVFVCEITVYYNRYCSRDSFQRHDKLVPNLLSYQGKRPGALSQLHCHTRSHSMSQLTAQLSCSCGELGTVRKCGTNGQ